MLSIHNNNVGLSFIRLNDKNETATEHLQLESGITSQEDSGGSPARSDLKNFNGTTAFLKKKSSIGHSTENPRMLKIFIDPAFRSKISKETQDLAFEQTVAARNLLYYPGKNLRQQIIKAATVLNSIVSQLTNKQQAALVARLFGSEGILPNNQPEELQRMLERLMGDSSSPSATATDRAAFICLLGDIGALYADSGATTGVDGRTEQQTKNLRDRLDQLITRQGFSPISLMITEKIQNLAGSSAVGPTKKQERIRPPSKKPLRSGIHDVGDDADKKILVTVGQLPKVRWDVAHLDESRLVNTIEPMVGHMSGSPAEILKIWDMLCGVRDDQLYIEALKSHAEVNKSVAGIYHPKDSFDKNDWEGRLARNAGACAMLVGIGFHSAVEVLEGALTYLGQNIRSVIGKNEDAGKLFGMGAATDLISEMFLNQTETSPEKY